MLFFSSSYFKGLFLKNMGGYFLMHCLLFVIMLLQFKQLRLFSLNLLCNQSKTHTASTCPTACCELAVPSCLSLALPWHKTMSWNIFILPISFHPFFSSKTNAFTWVSSSHISQWSVGVREITKQPFHNISVPWGGISFLMFVNILTWLSFFHIQLFSLKECCDFSFLPSWLSVYLSSLTYFCHYNQSKHKNRHKSIWM